MLNVPGLAIFDEVQRLSYAPEKESPTVVKKASQSVNRNADRNVWGDCIEAKHG